MLSNFVKITQRIDVIFCGVTAYYTILIQLWNTYHLKGIKEKPDDFYLSSNSFNF